MGIVRRQIRPHAARLRQGATEAEQLIWSHLRNRQIHGFKFRRQVTIGLFIVDFLCSEVRLIIEIDGGQHSPESDEPRSAALEAQGYWIIRFWNHDVLQNIDGVLQTIATAQTGNVEK